jgi:hypothetical protein
MARSIFKAKTSKVSRAATSAPSPDASAYCRDLDNWPRSWMGLEKDLPPGEELVACLRPFIEHLASSSLSPKTIRRHVGNLWMLGGEIIRDMNDTPSRRKVAANKLLRDAVHADGGPTRKRSTLPRFNLSQTPPLSPSISELSPASTMEKTAVKPPWESLRDSHFPHSSGDGAFHFAKDTPALSPLFTHKFPRRGHTRMTAS